MTPEQLQWSDKQWAKYLGCTVWKYKKACKILQKRFAIDVFKKDDTDKYYIALTKRQDTPYGKVRYVPQIATSIEFDSVDSAVNYANETLIPSLELAESCAASYNMPTKMLQTLHIKNR